MYHLVLIHNSVLCKFLKKLQFLFRDKNVTKALQKEKHKYQRGYLQNLLRFTYAHSNERSASIAKKLAKKL